MESLQSIKNNIVISGENVIILIEELDPLLELAEGPELFLYVSD